MDITLERILSLIPKKQNGDFVHGEKKKFAVSIGFKSGEIVSMWINGSSKSYMGKLHEISAKYNVSVDWLQGKSDQKEIPPTEKVDGMEEELIQIFRLLPDDLKAGILAQIKAVLVQRGLLPSQSE